MAFEVAARSNPEHELLLWLPELEAKDEYVWGYERKVLTPDAYGRYKFGDRVLSFFLEVDQATMTTKRWREKVDRYIEYPNSGRYEERFGMKFFRVLVVTTTVKRLASLLAAAEPRRDDHLWFTTLEQIRRDGPVSLVWTRAGVVPPQGLLG